MPKLTTRSWWLWGGVGLLLLVGIVLLLLLPTFIDFETYQEYLLAQLETHLGSKVEVGSVEIDIFPGVHIDLHSISFLTKDARPMFKADHLALHLKLLPLLQGRVVVKRLVLDRPELLTSHPDDGSFDISEIFRPRKNARSLTGVDPGMFSDLRTFIIRDGTIVLRNTESSSEQPARRLEQLNIIAYFRGFGVPSDIVFHASIPQLRTRADLTFNGTLAIMIAKTIRQQTSDHPPFEYEFAGQFRISTLDLSEVRRIFTGDEPEWLTGVIDVTGALAGRVGLGNRYLQFTDVEVRTDIVTVSTSGSLWQRSDQTWRVQSEATSSPFDVQNVTERYLTRRQNDGIQAMIRDSSLQGTAQVIDARIAGEWHSNVLPTMTVTGTMRLEGVNARIGDGGVPAKDLHAFLALHEDRLEVNSITGWYGDSKILNGSGRVTEIYESPQLTMELHGLVPTGQLLTFLSTLNPERKGEKNMWAFTAPTGLGRISLEMSGPLSPNQLEYRGVIESQGMSFHSTWMGLPVTHLRGRLRFSPGDVVLSQLTGTVGKSDIGVDAYFRNGDDKIVLDARADSRELLDLLATKGEVPALPPDVTLRGKSTLGITMRMRGDRTIVSGTLDLKDTDYYSRSGIIKPIGTAAAADVELILHGEERVHIQKLDLSLPPLLLSLTGEVTRTSPPRFAVSASSRRANLETLHHLAPQLTIANFHPESGVIDVNLKITGEGWKRQTLRLTGAVSLQHGRLRALLSPQDEPVLIEDLNAALRFNERDNGRIEVESLSGIVKHSQLRISGTVTDLRVFPRVELSIESPQFDFGVIIPDDERSPFRTLLESLSQTTILEANVRIDAGHYRGVTWKDVLLDVTGMDGGVHVRIRNAQLGQGRVQGQTTLQIAVGAPMEMDGQAELQKVPAGEIIRLFGGDDSMLSGTATIRGALAGNGRHELGLSPTLNGRLRLELSKGRIRKFNALSQILNILNLPQLLSGRVPDLSSKGLAFDTITATMNIKNGQIRIEELFLDSPVIKMAGAGSYDIPQDNFDMIVVVSPLGAYEDLLKSLPIFSYIIFGKEKGRGIFTAMFEVRGRLQDSQVTLLPGKSVASGLKGFAEMAVGVLKNTLLLPKELIAPGGGKR